MIDIFKKETPKRELTEEEKKERTQKWIKAKNELWEKVNRQTEAVASDYVQDIFHRNGISFGNNSISGNVILVDRNQLMNGNSFILGTSGSGKSMEAKNEIINLILATDADVIIIDPKREYVPLVNALHGERVVLSASSDNHINALDINAEYGEGKNPLTDKVEFILSLCEQIDEVTPKQKSIIDRCCRYTSYYMWKVGSNRKITLANKFSFKMQMITVLP